VCTPAATQYAIAAEKAGIPSVVVTAPGFADLAWLTGYNAGIPAEQVAIYPNAFENDTDKQLQDNTKNILVPQIIERLTKPVDLAAAAKKATDLGITGPSDPKTVIFTGTLDEVNRAFTITNLTDGMAIIPPTAEKIQEFLNYTDRPPTEQVALLPSATAGPYKATPWNIAVNGVMAGCRPEYMPILIAAIEAMAAGSGDALGSSGTHSNIPFYWVNGPVARQLGLSNGQGLITDPHNTVIGRALSLMVQNLAGFRVAQTRMGTFGYPVSWVLTENEAFLKSINWQPYHVERGFDKNANTVTGSASCMWGQNNIPATSDPKLTMQLMSYDIVYGEGFASGSIGSARTVLVTPPVARLLASGGYTKQTLISDIKSVARKVTYEMTFSQVYGSPGMSYPPFEEQLKINLASASAEKGKLPPWLPKITGWEEIQTTPSVNNMEILVCGDPSRNKTQTMGGPGASSPRPIKEIKLPAKWDDLMSKLGYQPLKSFYL
jgi:hypothetical protein